jgi:hypothetical protein
MRSASLTGTGLMAWPVAVRRRVAEDHGAGGALDLGQGALEGEPGQGVGEGLAEAVGEAGADQLLDHVLLDQHPAQYAGEIAEQRAVAVAEVGVDDDLDRLRRDHRQRLDGLGGAPHVVVLVGQLEGEVLAHVADAGGAGGERRRRVLDRGRGAQHPVAEMGGHRRRVGQSHEVLGALQDHAGAARHLLPLGGGVAHVEVEADAVAVDPVAGAVELLVDLGVGAAALLEVAKADVGVQHHPALGGARPLVLGLRGDPVGLEERRGADPVLACERPALGHQLARVGEPGFGKDGVAAQLQGHRRLITKRPRRLYPTRSWAMSMSLDSISSTPGQATAPALAISALTSTGRLVLEPAGT